MRKLIFLPVLLFTLFSCDFIKKIDFPPKVFSDKNFANFNLSGTPAVKPQARPLAILQTGALPIWFMITDNGPVHIESIEDAVYSAAFIPWTLAPHVRFFNEKHDELVMAVNRDGFLKLAPNSGEVEGLVMYRFGGGELWRQYTVGSFVSYDEKHIALLYLDDRFLDSNAPVPSPGTWTFNMESNNPFPAVIPALDIFSAAEGWEANTLRLGDDGFWYYRVKKGGAQPEIKTLRTDNLSKAGEEAALEDFYNSAPRKISVNHPLLPSLPEGFVYTGSAFVGNSLFACWEEQNEFYIGAAGFMVIKAGQ